MNIFDIGSMYTRISVNNILNKEDSLVVVYLLKESDLAKVIEDLFTDNLLSHRLLIELARLYGTEEQLYNFIRLENFSKTL